ncbi:hypothetical protein JMUB7529_28160 [Staphylococcus aureus]
MSRGLGDVYKRQNYIQPKISMIFTIKKAFEIKNLKRVIKVLG